MLTVTVDLIPGGRSALRRTIATMRIANESYLADLSDYSVEAVEGPNPLTGEPARHRACMVLAHDRRQSVWILLGKACTEIAEAEFAERSSK